MRPRWQKTLADYFGFAVDPLVMADGNLRDTLAKCPDPDAAGNRMLAYLCFDEPSPDMDRVAALKALSETLTIVGNTVWLHAPDGIGSSKLANALDLGVPSTARNLNTLRKVVAML